MEKEDEEDLSRRYTETMVEENDKTVISLICQNFGKRINRSNKRNLLKYVQGAGRNFRKKFQVEIQIRLHD